jgi:hypothetical protein
MERKVNTLVFLERELTGIEDCLHMKGERLTIDQKGD